MSLREFLEWWLFLHVLWPQEEEAAAKQAEARAQQAKMRRPLRG